MLYAISASPFFAAAAKASTQEPAMVTVVLTGLVLVFSILILLCLIVMLEGKIFQSLDKRKEAKKNAPAAPAPTTAAPAAPAPVSVAPVMPDAPAIEGRVPPDVVAAITAAVAAATEGKFTLRSVSTVKQGRGQWGLAGIIQNTEPF